MRIAYIMRAHPGYPRCTRECNALVRAGHEVTYIGWDIEPQENRKHELAPEVRVELLRLPSKYGRFETGKWMRWYCHLVRSVGFRRFDAVHCVDEYPAVMLVPFKRILYRWMVMDVYDSIIRRKAANRLVAWGIRAVRWLANSASDLIIETSDELKATLGRFADKAIVVVNSPPDPLPEIGMVAAPTAGPLKVAVGGMIHRKRMSLDVLLAVLDRMGPNQVRVMSSGFLGDDFSREVWVKHPCVEHRWLETNREYFRELAACDLVYGVRADAEDSYYRSLVFPQKVFDAMAVGRPVVVGRENWVSSWVLKHGVGLACSFKDVDEMAGVFAKCAQRGEDIQAISGRGRRLFKEHYDWPVVEQVLLRGYAGLIRGKRSN